MKGRKWGNTNYSEKVCQQDHLDDIKTDKKNKTKRKETKANLNQSMNTSGFECLKKNYKKDKNIDKGQHFIKCLHDTSVPNVISNSFETKKVLNKCKKKQDLYYKIKKETEASDNDSIDKISLEYAKKTKKSKKKSKKEAREQHKSRLEQNKNVMLLTIPNAYPKVEGEKNIDNNKSGVSYQAVDETPFASNNHRKRKRDHSEAENGYETNIISIKYKKRKRKRNTAEKDDKTPTSSNSHTKKKLKYSKPEKDDKMPIASNYHKKRKLKHSEVAVTSNENNLDRKQDVSMSFSKHKKKKKSHRKSYSL